MALLNKLFSPRKKINKNIVCDLKQEIARPFCIKKEDIRVLLFQDCDRSGRKLLFDSSAIEIIKIDDTNKSFQEEFSKIFQTVPDNTTPGIIEVSNGFAYEFKPTNNDGRQLSEMIFGTVAMSYHGVSLKFHILNEPQRLMCAKVYGVPVRLTNQFSNTEKNSSASDLPSTSPSKPQLSTLSIPVDTMPSKSDSGYSLNFSFVHGDSGIFYDRSPRSSVSSSYFPDVIEIFNDEDSNSDFFYEKQFTTTPVLNSSNSGSFNRRLLRNISTKLEPLLEVFHQHDKNQPMISSKLLSKQSLSPSSPTTSDSLISSSSSISGSVTRRVKLGLAVIITLAEKLEIKMLQYFLQHSPQLEAMLMRLSTAVNIAAMIKGKRKNNILESGFISSMVLAVNDIVQGLIDLVNSPQIPSVWLNIMSKGDYKQNYETLQENFIRNLSFLLCTADTKDTNFFISSLMTSLLTHHLGWVATVSPYEVKASGAGDTWNILTLKYPYNPLWAQLGDLYGALSTPLKTSRTVLCGNNTHLLSKLLSILTYFIRCGSVKTQLFKTGQFSSKDKISNTITNSSNLFRRSNVSIPNNNLPESINKSNLRRVQNFTVQLDMLNTLDNFNNLDINSDIDKRMNINPFKRSKTNNESLDRLCDSSEIHHTENKENFNSPPDSDLCILKEEIDNKNLLYERQCMNVEQIMYMGNKIDELLSEGTEKNVLFVLGDNDKLVGLKNKQINNPINKLQIPIVNNVTGNVADPTRDPPSEQSSTSKSCSVASCQHSKSKKHSGVKFEFDKYPQIVTNYLKSKNLEWLDRNYIGKPGNIKINGFDFDPVTSLTLMDDSKCEQCLQCNSTGFLLQTPSNASELEFTSDLPSENEYQQAKEKIVESNESLSDIEIPKTFIRNQLENTFIVNVPGEETNSQINNSRRKCSKDSRKSENYDIPENASCDINFIEVPFIIAEKDLTVCDTKENSFDSSLLGGVTDHYIPDMVIQGVLKTPQEVEGAVRRELSQCSQGNLLLNQGPSHAVAIIADTQEWCVHVWDVGGVSYEVVFSPLVASIFDVLPIMIQSKTSPQRCISFIESKLRELCIRSKTLADLLMSTDFCDMDYLTKALNIDSNDVPLLMAIATTHTPQISLRYGVSFR